MGWCLPSVSGAPPAARAFHSTSIRPPAEPGSIEQLLLLGGTDGVGRPTELYVLSMPAYEWSCPRVGGGVPRGRCWHALVGLPSASSFRAIVYGGTDAAGRPLRDCHMLRPLMEPQVPEAATAAGGKDAGKGGKKDDKGKGAPPPAPAAAEEEEDTRPIEFEWSAVAPSPPPLPPGHKQPSAAKRAGGALPARTPAAAGTEPPMADRSPMLSASLPNLQAPLTSSAPPTAAPGGGGGGIGGGGGGGGSIVRPSTAKGSLPGGATAFAPAASNGVVRKPRPPLAVSPAAVATADHAVYIFGGSADGAPLDLIHLYRPSELLGESDEAVTSASAAPPTLAIRNVRATGLPPRFTAASLASDCCVLLRRTDHGEELGRSALLPYTAEPNAKSPALVLTGAAASWTLPTEDGFAGDGALALEVHIGAPSSTHTADGPTTLVGSAPLHALLKKSREGCVSRVRLAPHGCLLSFDFSRLGAPSAGMVPPPPAPPPPSDTSAKAALEGKAAGSAARADEYAGQFVDGVPQGKGTCRYASGAVYEGGWERGMRHGQGEYKDEFGSVYKGGWEDDACAGLGMWHYADGSTYTGPMVGGMRHGHGTYRSFEGGVYEGEWLRGLRSGRGVDRDASGLVVYTGHFLADKKHGTGRLSIKESHRSNRTSVYDGQYQHGARYGTGVFTWPNGDTYDGCWQSDRRNGRGVLRTIDGDVYDGKFVGDEKCGDGALRTAGGEAYMGQWLHSERNGKGGCTYADGSRYEGEWRDGRQHGKGAWAAADGVERYEGSWSMGQRHGAGTHVSAHGDVYVGSFHADLKSGTGRLDFVDGSKYDGEFKEGVQCGSGSFWAADGEHYTGAWAGGERCGFGRCEYANGDVHEGLYQHGVRHGRGKTTYARLETWQAGFTPREVQLSALPVYSAKREAAARAAAPDSALAVAAPVAAFNPLDKPTLSSGSGGLSGLLSTAIEAEEEEEEPTVYEGEWADDERNGRGKMSGGGEAYDGQWEAGRRHGRGVCFYPDGECYVGEWVDGRRQGEGSLAN